MNMSDDVSSAVIGISSQVAQKGAETIQHAIDKTIDNIAKLLQTLFENKERANASNKVKSSDMTDLKSGEVEIKKLAADARKKGDSLISTDGFSKAEAKFIIKKAKEYGVPVAFTSKKNADNICAHVRGSDKAVLDRVCAELMQGKMKTRPQELDNFKVEKWEINGIQRELSKHDLCANWGLTKGGEYFCLFEKVDKKAVLMARSEFVRKCGEVEKDFTVINQDGFFTLKDEKNGAEITFDEVPSKSELSEMLQERFGYDENKAEIACGKFCENHLDGDLKRDFLTESPQKEFSLIENHIELKGESLLVKEYDCLRVTPKADGVPALVYRDENNNFAVLYPEKTSAKEMSEIIKERLGITDEKTISALVDKADKVNDFYVKQNGANFTASYSSETADGKILNVESAVERLDKNSFKVETAAQIREFGKFNLNETKAGNAASLTLSFSDKKSALNQLQKMYERQGISPDEAKQCAKETFAKARAQSPEKVLQIEEIKAVNTNETREVIATVKFGAKSEEINLTERESAISEIDEKFAVGISEAEMFCDKAWDKIDDDYYASLYNSEAPAETVKSVANGHEKHLAEPVNLETKPDLNKDVKTPDLPKSEVITPRKR